MKPSSFEKQIVEQAPRLRSFVRAQVRSAADADDLAHDTLVKAFQSRDSLRNEERLQAWLFRIARRTIIDFYRRQRPSEKLADAATDSSEVKLDAVSAAVGRAALCYLNTLPEAYRVAVKMAEWDGLPHAAVAARLGITLAAAKSRVLRGKQRIRFLMEQCCVMVYDARGKVVDYERRQPCARFTCCG